MKEKILTFINNLKEKLKNNEKLAGVVEKAHELVDKLRQRNKKETEKSSKFQRVITRRLKRIFSLKSVSTFLAIIISVPALIFCMYAFWQNMQGNHYDKESMNRIINSNLDYATTYMIKELKHRRIKKKQIRKLIKDLNGMDEKGRMHKYSPCEDFEEFMFGEQPAPGNVVITKPESYEFQITSYSCSMEALVTKNIKLKPPPRKPKSKTTKTHHKNTKSKDLKPLHKEEPKIEFTGNPAITRPVHNEQTKPLYNDEVKDQQKTEKAHLEAVHKEEIKDQHKTEPAHSETTHKEEIKDQHKTEPAHSKPVHH